MKQGGRENDLLILRKTSQPARVWTEDLQPGMIEVMTHRKSRTQKKTRQRDSIRVKLGYKGGPWTIADARAMVIDALDQAAATGITHIARANLYLNPVDEKGRIVTRVGRHPLPDIDVPHPYRSAADEHGL